MNNCMCTQKGFTGAYYSYFDAAPVYPRLTDSYDTLFNELVNLGYTGAGATVTVISTCEPFLCKHTYSCITQKNASSNHIE